MLNRPHLPSVSLTEAGSVENEKEKEDHSGLDSSS